MFRNQQLKTLLLAAFLMLSSLGHAQDKLGLVFSNYSGISASLTNPAMLTGSRVYLDVNVIGAAVFANNDMFYFPPEYNTIWNLISSRGTYQVSEGGEFKFDRTFNYFDNTNKKYLVADVSILGPAAMYQKGKHSFGINTSLRSVHSGNNIPYEMPIIMYQGTSQDYHFLNYNNNDFGIVSMSWGEIGLSYANDIYNYNKNKLTVGATAKILLGYQGAYVATKNINYMFTGNHTVNIQNLDTEVAYALPVGYDNPEQYDILNFGTKPIIKGIGLGLDIGFVYTRSLSPSYRVDRRRACAQPFIPYQYKIGISIMDMGGINFNKHASVHSFENVSANWQQFDTVTFRGIDETMKMLSQVFYGDSTASYSGNKFRIGLPTTISLQFDYRLNDNFYIAAIWKQPIILKLSSLWRTPNLAIVPRYETRFFGVSLPFSLINYRQPEIGLAVRIYSLTVGTEMLSSWLSVTNLTGVDIYFSLKFSLDKGRCLDRGKGACDNADFGNR